MVCVCSVVFMCECNNKVSELLRVCLSECKGKVSKHAIVYAVCLCVSVVGQGEGVCSVCVKVTKLLCVRVCLLHCLCMSEWPIV